MKKTLLLSMLGHITFFSIFSFSFGYKIPKADFTEVYFLGSLLEGINLRVPISYNPAGNEKGLFFNRYNKFFSPINKKYPATPSTDSYLKPLLPIAFNEEKTYLSSNAGSLSIRQRRPKSVVFFHPRLPYHFLLFFKDRQAVHIELMFKVLPEARLGAIVTKRRISSGNLEADLLSMRYVGHYLYIEQPRLATDSWQAVKIDLSAKEGAE